MIRDDMLPSDMKMTMGDKITEAPYVLDRRDGRVYINHKGFFRRDYLVPYWGKIGKDGKADNFSEKVFMPTSEEVTKLKKELPGIEQKQRVAEETPKGRYIKAELKDGVVAKDLMPGSSKQEAENLNEDEDK